MRSVGVVLFDRFELLDVFGPLEIFGVLRNHFEIVMIGPAGGVVASSQGPLSVVDVAYADAPRCDVVMVPGGAGTRTLVEDDGFIAWLAGWAPQAEVVSSVCTGSGVLARAGMLDGYRATSNKRDFGFAVSQGPRVEWVRQARWVADRDRWTSSGVAAGMDMALALVADLVDEQTAVTLANAVELDWHRDSSWDPFAALNGLVDP